jgi:hypothetical protein
VAGIWRHHFHWSVLLRWEVLGWILPILPAIAGLFLYFDQYRGANVCFIVTSLFIFAKVAHIAIPSKDHFVSRFFFTFLLFGIVGVTIVETIRGIDNWRKSKIPPPSIEVTVASPEPSVPHQVIGTATLEVRPAAPVPDVPKSKTKESEKKPAVTKAAMSIATEKRLPSADEDLPWGLEVTLVANEDVSPLAIEIEFTGEVGKFMATKPLGAFEQEQGGIIVERPDTILMERKSPAFTPQQPIIVWVYSETQIKTKKLRSIPFSFPYPSGYLK